ncbi:hypothetical protein JANAI61_37310 [Jannaschia sp. AI_61]|uniref:spike base protein, RCAP_Rcc01079 family n=1 Tax=Jannaschia sp. AI_61 TaxID=2829796 RepID=UPI001BBA28F9|nr:hypothetical protein [Jannaschia sp. AI_61]GIT93273.1 hypothetical protein JANAI61_37310 [Jannaschia sp. AI_61]
MSSIDTFRGQATSLESPITNAQAVTPSDGADLSHATRALYVGQGGDLRVDMVGGATVTFVGLTAGWHPIRVTRVHATSTTADHIVGGW